MKISENIATILENDEIIDSKEKQIYEFGFRQLFSIIIDTIITIFIGVLMKKPLEMFVFIASFSLIRKYAGGYHAPKRILCLIYSIVIQIIAIEMISNYIESFSYLTILSVIGICILSPIDTKNNKLDSREVGVYRKKSVALTVLATLFVATTALFGMDIYYKAVSVAMIWIFISLVLGWIDGL